jgi:DNA-binding transcriptional regulator YhcF (GntR family)
MRVVKTKNKETYKLLNELLLKGNINFKQSPRALKQLEKDGFIFFDNNKKIIKKNKNFKVYMY